MKQIRRSIFETNSSSSHSITLCTKSEYDDWSDGKLFLNDFWRHSTSEYADKKFVTKDEAIDIISKSDTPHSVESELDSFLTSDDYWDRNDDLEGFEEHYDTPGGESVVAFGAYGYR